MHPYVSSVEADLWMLIAFEAFVSPKDMTHILFSLYFLLLQSELGCLPNVNVPIAYDVTGEQNRFSDMLGQHSVTELQPWLLKSLKCWSQLIFAMLYGKLIPFFLLIFIN